MTDATTTPTDKAGEHCDVHHLLVEFANSIKGASLDKRIEYLRVFTDRINALTHPQPSLSVGLDRDAVARRIARLVNLVAVDFTPVERKAYVTLETDAILALSAPAEGWQGIETAPNNTDHMRPILLFWKHAGVGLGWYDVDEEFEDRPRNWKCLETGWRCEGDQCIPMNQEDCTHWMPLPAAPTGETGA